MIRNASGRGKKGSTEMAILYIDHGGNWIGALGPPKGTLPPAYLNIR